ARDPRAGIDEDDVKLRVESADVLHEALQAPLAQVGQLIDSRASGKDPNPRRSLRDDFVEFLLAVEDVAQIKLRRDAEHDVHVGQSQIPVEDAHLETQL